MTQISTHPETQAPDEVEMQIRGLMIDPLTNMPIVVLKDVAGDTEIGRASCRERV